jgi:DNA repair exonuclease SbcCD ATPase subunit
MELKQIKSKVQEMAKARDYHRSHLIELQRNKSTQEKRLDHAGQARTFIQTVANEVQQNLEHHIASVVTLALSVTIPSPIEFVVRFEQRRGRTECDLLFNEQGENYRPLDGSGFGAVDVASSALRFVFWSLNKNRPTMILDEPFRNVSPDLHDKLSEMLQMISKDLHIQIIMVSHSEDVNVKADRTFVVSKEGRYSKVS